ncbi:hypothetical protein IJZ97_06355 [bacterium]|nr:hypothetical protein [bacterium]
MDKKVVVLDEKLYGIRPEICKTLNSFKESVAKFVLGVHTMVEFGKKQRQKYMITTVQNILIYLLLFLMKDKSKKYASAMRMALSLRDCWACNS